MPTKYPNIKGWTNSNSSDIKISITVAQHFSKIEPSKIKSITVAWAYKLQTKHRWTEKPTSYRHRKTIKCTNKINGAWSKEIQIRVWTFKRVIVIEIEKDRVTKMQTKISRSGYIEYREKDKKEIWVESIRSGA